MRHPPVHGERVAVQVRANILERRSAVLYMHVTAAAAAVVVLLRICRRFPSFIFSFVSFISYYSLLTILRYISFILLYKHQIHHARRFPVLRTSQVLLLVEVLYCSRIPRKDQWRLQLCVDSWIKRAASLDPTRMKKVVLSCMYTCTTV